MEHKIIAKFNNENKEYYIIQNENNIINYAIIENGKVNIDLSKDDLELFKYIHQSIKINPNTSIDLGKIIVNDKEFQIYYDIKNKLHYWYKIENNKLVEADYDENCKFNLKYNNNVLIFNIGKTNQNQKFIKRFVRSAKKVLLVSITAGVSLVGFSECKANNILETDSSHRIIVKEEVARDFEIPEGFKNYIISNKEGRYDRPYDYNEIRNSIKDNPYLKDEEKNLLSNLKFVFDENHQYMDMNEMARRFKSLRIAYINEVNEYSSGTYSPTENMIRIYKASNFNDANIAVLLHELGHVLQTYTDSNNRFILELSNELFSREVMRRLLDMGLLGDSEKCKNEYGKYSKFGSRGYANYMFIEYGVAELLTQEQMKDYQFWPDEEILVSALLEMDGMPKERINEILKNRKKDSKDTSEDELAKVKKAYKLLDTIDSFREYNEEKGVYDVKNSFEEYVKRYCEIYKELDYYYVKKYGKSMDQCIEMGLQDKDLFNNIKVGEYSIDNIFKFIKEDWIKADFLDKEDIPKVFLSTHDKAFSETVAELSELNLEDDEWGTMVRESAEITFSKQIYYLPKTYFSDKHKYGYIYVNPLKCNKSTIRLDEETQKNFENNYNRIKKGKNEDKEYSEEER